MTIRMTKEAYDLERKRAKRTVSLCVAGALLMAVGVALALILLVMRGESALFGPGLGAEAPEGGIETASWALPLGGALMAGCASAGIALCLRAKAVAHRWALTMRCAKIMGEDEIREAIEEMRASGKGE